MLRRHGEKWIGVERLSHAQTSMSVVIAPRQYQSVAKIEEEKRRFPCMLRRVCVLGVAVRAVRA
jgi:hypothetical protein